MSGLVIGEEAVVDGTGRRGIAGGRIGRGGSGGIAEAPVCEKPEAVVAVKVLRSDPLRVRMPSLRGCGGGRLRLGDSLSDDGASRSLSWTSPARSSDSSSSLTLVFLV
jgi:hypothetical protein